ncbi:MAG: homocysteine S-methyltransferase family protein [Kiritimatiellae bacterium]|nr:homocysteine S-methyltransferase family protein [Kiritimatiellia bacterium]MBR4251087.1 homocysteine S-methyltransferase family protein [Kiritimatiellia bacterium]
MNTILDLIQKRLVFADGGFGSLLIERGFPGGIPEEWNLSHPGAVESIHLDYYRAGSDYVHANTFGSNRVKLAAEGPGAAALAVRCTAAGVAAARRARHAAGGGDRFVALDVGPTGKLLAPLGDLAFEDAVAAFAEQIRAGADAGADFVSIETMGDIYELKAAVLAAKENCSLPVFATVAFGTNGKLLTGADPAAVVALLEGLGVDALGLNCGLGPDMAAPLAAEFVRLSSLPVIVKPNAGLPRVEAGRTVYDVGPDDFAALMTEIARAGARVLGGCCGTTPAHLAALRRACGGIAPLPVTRKSRTWVSCATHAVELCDATPAIVGERINPTGKKRFQLALREGDFPYILRQGLEQRDAGAHVLDVNVGVPGLDETALLPRTVRELQAVVDLPLQLDTSDPAAMEAALRACAGKPMVNSVSGKAASLAAVLPLVRKYGGVAVGLCLDDSGIPDTAEGRLAVARRIVLAAEDAGIDRRDIVIDPLCLSVSAEPRAADVTLRAIELVRKELGVGCILGVSNVSFGLPRRETVNAAFLLLALRAGLTAAIVNPCNAPVLDAYRTYRALLGLDPHCEEYIRTHAGLPPAAPAAPIPSASAPAQPASPTPPADGPGALADAVRRGLKAEAARLAADALAAPTDPLALIDGAIVPALDDVGRQFEAGTLYLPQLLVAADAASAAFEEIKKNLAASGTARESAGRVVLATVKGDVHDIGKNIVRALLENYGFDVLDLGKDVPPERIADTAARENIRLVGLSALMTTTVPAMEETIRQLRARCPDCKVMVGGAVLTQDCADRIGADFYGRDAMTSVRYALSLFGRPRAE